jgi:hypothetical protein
VTDERLAEIKRLVGEMVGDGTGILDDILDELIAEVERLRVFDPALNQRQQPPEAQPKQVCAKCGGYNPHHYVHTDSAVPGYHRFVHAQPMSARLARYDECRRNCYCKDKYVKCTNCKEADTIALEVVPELRDAAHRTAALERERDTWRLAYEASHRHHVICIAQREAAEQRIIALEQERDGYKQDAFKSDLARHFTEAKLQAAERLRKWLRRKP